MPKQLFSNNASTTLSAAITSGATSISVATGKGALFNSPASGNYELLTITDGTNYEVVKCTARSGDVFTVSRAQESTTARAWSAGAIIAGYITKSTLEAFRSQGQGIDAIEIGYSASASGDEAISIGRLANASGSGATAIGVSSVASSASSTGIGNSASATNTNSTAIGKNAIAKTRTCAVGANANNWTLGVTLNAWAPNTTYSVNDYKLIGTDVCACVVAGQSGATQPSIAVENGATFLDGTVVWRRENENTQSDTAIGCQANSQFYAVAVGDSAKAFDFGVGIGKDSFAGQSGVAIGAETVTGSASKIAIGYQTRNELIEKSIKISALPAMEHLSEWWFGAEYSKYTGLVGQIASEYIDLTGGSAWSSTTAITHGHVRRPTTSNGCQYSRFDYAIKTKDPQKLTYTPSNTGSTEPNWPTVFADSVTDGYGDWICMPHDGSYVMSLPASMMIEEVYFICYEAQGISAQASISIGTTGNLTKIVNNQPTVGLTENLSVTKWVPTQPIIVPDITIKIDTLATGTKMLGKFMFRGFYTQFT